MIGAGFAMIQPSRPTVFFGYPFEPKVRSEAVVTAAKRLENTAAITHTIWEALSINGRFVIDRILAAIDEADVAAFDVTELNHNVMFELGYAIGKDRKIWLLRDESNVPATRNWNRVKILTTIGYSQFTNSDHIVKSFWDQQPHSADTTIFQTAVRDYLQPSGSPAIFYLPSLYETEAGRKLTRRINRETQRGLRLITADPAESSVQSLAWYAQQIYSSDVVVSHFSSPDRRDADVHNARCALVSGLAKGMNKSLLMLAEEDYATPIDYRDLLYVYPSAKECLSSADTWLERNLAPAYKKLAQGPATKAHLDLAVELRSLRIGDPIAENEAGDLPDYFVETASFFEVLERKTTVFVGRKGTGKTANLIRAADRLAEDKRNLVCVIKPSSYELEGVLKLMTQYQERATQGYLVESLWKFLVYSEIANSAYDEIRARPAEPTPGSPEDDLVRYMQGPGALVRDEFAVRLETTVDRLLGLSQQTGLSEQRIAISNALHDGVLRDLREHLGKVLSQKLRVAVLVDNLDKAWHRTVDIDRLAAFLLGLLSSVGRISDEFGASDHWRKPVTVTLAVFLRSDIYEHVARIAREPDKIPSTRLIWGDRDLLLRVMEERYAACRGQDVDRGELWERFFCQTTRGLPTPDYILGRVLPRPRDLIYFCGAAIAAAINRRSPVVEEQDIQRAEALYSQFALEALQVENGVTMAELEQVLYEFAGTPSVLTRDQIQNCIKRAGVDEERTGDIVQHLHALSFLGVEIGQDQWDFAYELRTPALADALARRHTSQTGGYPRFQIHPAFRSYLEIREELP